MSSLGGGGGGQSRTLLGVLVDCCTIWKFDSIWKTLKTQKNFLPSVPHTNIHISWRIIFFTSTPGDIITDHSRISEVLQELTNLIELEKIENIMNATSRDLEV